VTLAFVSMKDPTTNQTPRSSISIPKWFVDYFNKLERPEVTTRFGDFFDFA